MPPKQQSASAQTNIDSSGLSCADWKAVGTLLCLHQETPPAQKQPTQEKTNAQLTESVTQEGEAKPQNNAYSWTNIWAPPGNPSSAPLGEEASLPPMINAKLKITHYVPGSTPESPLKALCLSTRKRLAEETDSSLGNSSDEGRDGRPPKKSSIVTTEAARTILGEAAKLPKLNAKQTALLAKNLGLPSNTVNHWLRKQRRLERNALRADTSSTEVSMGNLRN